MSEPNETTELGGGVLGLIVESETHGRQVIRIDAVDYPLVAAHRWHVQSAGGTLYACTNAPSSGRTRVLRMHRLLVNPGPGLVVDHRNGDGLDNTRANIRECTQRQNTLNRGPDGGNRHGFKGVAWAPELGKFRGRITVGGRTRWLGCHVTAEAAARAYDVAAVELFGEFAKTNGMLGLLPAETSAA